MLIVETTVLIDGVSEKIAFRWGTENIPIINSSDWFMQNISKKTELRVIKFWSFDRFDWFLEAWTISNPDSNWINSEIELIVYRLGAQFGV